MGWLMVQVIVQDELTSTAREWDWKLVMCLSNSETFKIGLNFWLCHMYFVLPCCSRNKHRPSRLPCCQSRPLASSFDAENSAPHRLADCLTRARGFLAVGEIATWPSLKAPLPIFDFNPKLAKAPTGPRQNHHARDSR